MALYTQLFGENKEATSILGFANLNREMFPRYRDVFLCDDGNNVIVYTRIGGPNRNNYKQQIKNIKQHKQFITDYDDKHDNTYAYFKFKVLPEYIDTTKIMFDEEPLTVWELFERHLKRAQDPNSEEYKKDLEIAKQLMDAINNQPNGGIIYM